MSILVIGGTGTVGSAVVMGLLARGESPRIVTRSRDKIPTLPTNVWGVEADLTRPETLQAAFEGVKRLVLITALSPTETDEGRAAVAAAKDAGVERVVFMSIHDVQKCPQAPHFQSKLDIEQSLLDSGMPCTLVMPNNFFQNDVWYREALLEHAVYPQPLGGVGLSRVDARDIAHALVVAVTEDGHEGQRYPLVGSEPLTGEQTAAAWSVALRKDVHYAGDDLDAWAAQAGQMMPTWLVDDLRTMYGFFQKEGLVASEEDIAKQAKLLGREPRRFVEYAREMALTWSA